MSNKSDGAKAKSDKSEQSGSAGAVDVDALALKVYELLKHELRIERERLPRADWQQD